jgi:hypothetical protein
VGLAHLRDESLVKLMRADPLPLERVIDEMRRLKAAHQRRRDEFEAELAGLDAESGRYLRYAPRKGVHAPTAFARWCQEVIDDLEAAVTPSGMTPLRAERPAM